MKPRHIRLFAILLGPIYFVCLLGVCVVANLYHVSADQRFFMLLGFAWTAIFAMISLSLGAAWVISRRKR